VAKVFQINDKQLVSSPVPLAPHVGEKIQYPYNQPLRIQKTNIAANDKHLSLIQVWSGITQVDYTTATEHSKSEKFLSAD